MRQLNQQLLTIFNPRLPILTAKTGEEHEESIHSIRAKLYTMAEDQSWKERGTGTLRVNIPKKPSDKRPARLVMRADGVLRVILNVSLFKGMKCELHEKFVRIIAFEDAKAVHYAIKVCDIRPTLAPHKALKKATDTFHSHLFFFFAVQRS